MTQSIVRKYWIDLLLQYEKNGAVALKKHILQMVINIGDLTRMTKPDDIPHNDSRIPLERPAQVFVQAWNLIISKWQQYEPRIKKIAEKDGNVLTCYHASEMFRLMGEIGKLNDFDYPLSLKVLDHMELQMEGKLTVIFLSGIRVTI